MSNIRRFGFTPKQYITNPSLLSTSSQDVVNTQNNTQPNYSHNVLASDESAITDVSESIKSIQSSSLKPNMNKDSNISEVSESLVNMNPQPTHSDLSSMYYRNEDLVHRNQSSSTSSSPTDNHQQRNGSSISIPTEDIQPTEDISHSLESSNLHNEISDRNHSTSKPVMSPQDTIPSIYIPESSIIDLNSTSTTRLLSTLSPINNPNDSRQLSNHIPQFTIPPFSSPESPSYLTSTNNCSQYIEQDTGTTSQYHQSEHITSENNIISPKSNISDSSKSNQIISNDISPLQSYIPNNQEDTSTSSSDGLPVKLPSLPILPPHSGHKNIVLRSPDNVDKNFTFDIPTVLNDSQDISTSLQENESLQSYPINTTNTIYSNSSPYSNKDSKFSLQDPKATYTLEISDDPSEDITPIIQPVPSKKYPKQLTIDINTEPIDGSNDNQELFEDNMELVSTHHLSSRSKDHSLFSSAPFKFYDNESSTTELSSISPTKTKHNSTSHIQSSNYQMIQPSTSQPSNQRSMYSNISTDTFNDNDYSDSEDSLIADSMKLSNSLNNDMKNTSLNQSYSMNNSSYKISTENPIPEVSIDTVPNNSTLFDNININNSLFDPTQEVHTPKTFSSPLSSPHLLMPSFIKQKNGVYTYDNQSLQSNPSVSQDNQLASTKQDSSIISKSNILFDFHDDSQENETLPNQQSDFNNSSNEIHIVTPSISQPLSNPYNDKHNQNDSIQSSTHPISSSDSIHMSSIPYSHPTVSINNQSSFIPNPSQNSSYNNNTYSNSNNNSSNDNNFNNNSNNPVYNNAYNNPVYNNDSAYNSNNNPSYNNTNNSKNSSYTNNSKNSSNKNTTSQDNTIKKTASNSSKGNRQSRLKPPSLSFVKPSSIVSNQSYMSESSQSSTPSINTHIQINNQSRSRVSSFNSVSTSTTHPSISDSPTISKQASVTGYSSNHKSNTNTALSNDIHVTPLTTTIKNSSFKSKIPTPRGLKPPSTFGKYHSAIPKPAISTESQNNNKSMIPSQSQNNNKSTISTESQNNNKYTISTKTQNNNKSMIPSQSQNNNKSTISTKAHNNNKHMISSQSQNNSKSITSTQYHSNTTSKTSTQSRYNNNNNNNKSSTSIPSTPSKNSIQKVVATPKASMTTSKINKSNEIMNNIPVSYVTSEIVSSPTQLTQENTLSQNTIECDNDVVLDNSCSDVKDTQDYVSPYMKSLTSKIIHQDNIIDDDDNEYDTSYEKGEDESVYELPHLQSTVKKLSRSSYPLIDKDYYSIQKKNTFEAISPNENSLSNNILSSTNMNSIQDTSQSIYTYNNTNHTPDTSFESIEEDDSFLEGVSIPNNKKSQPIIHHPMNDTYISQQTPIYDDEPQQPMDSSFVYNQISKINSLQYNMPDISSLTQKVIKSIDVPTNPVYDAVIDDETNSVSSNSHVSTSFISPLPSISSLNDHSTQSLKPIIPLDKEHQLILDDIVKHPRDSTYLLSEFEEDSKSFRSTVDTLKGQRYSQRPSMGSDSTKDRKSLYYGRESTKDVKNRLITKGNDSKKKSYWDNNDDIIQYNHDNTDRVISALNLPISLKYNEDIIDNYLKEKEQDPLLLTEQDEKIMLAENSSSQVEELLYELSIQIDQNQQNHVVISQLENIVNTQEDGIAQLEEILIRIVEEMESVKKENIILENNSILLQNKYNDYKQKSERENSMLRNQFDQDNHRLITKYEDKYALLETQKNTEIERLQEYLLQIENQNGITYTLSDIDRATYEDQIMELQKTSTFLENELNNAFNEINNLIQRNESLIHKEEKNTKEIKSLQNTKMENNISISNLKTQLSTVINSTWGIYALNEYHDKILECSKQMTALNSYADDVEEMNSTLKTQLKDSQDIIQSLQASLSQMDPDGILKTIESLIKKCNTQDSSSSIISYRNKYYLINLKPSEISTSTESLQSNRIKKPSSIFAKESHI
ncbi:hypothetical protein WA158_001245 [Blastocystis sp. Blastoise]